MSELHVYAGTLPEHAPANSFTSIQSAINAAVLGDIIHVRPGAYNENLLVRTSGITIVADEGPSVTVSTLWIWTWTRYGFLALIT